MDFFERQDQARRRTKLLVVLFGLALVLTVLAVNLVVALIFRFDADHPEDWVRLWDLRLFAGATVGTIAVILLGSLVKMVELRQGGAAVASSLGGTPIPAATTDPYERRLLNVVEEMALASGVPVPQVYLLGREPGINAFAAGLGTQDAALGVTRGALRYLTRDELQGVIGHEFSHILNGDMRLNLRLIGIIHGLLVLAIIGRQLLRVRTTGSRDSKGGNPLPLLGLALMILGGIGMLFGRLIKGAVSRQREYLADSAAVQFTRNPSGLAGALKKIGGLEAGSRLETPRAEEASHLFFGNGLRASWLGLFSTHPPLVDRIRRLDPQFDGRFPQVQPVPATELPPGVSAASGLRAQPLAVPQGERAVTAHDAFPPRLTGAVLVDQVGRPTPAHLQQAGRLLERLPARLAAAAHDPAEAAGLVLSLVLDRDAERRQAQLQFVDEASRSALSALAPQLDPGIEALDLRDRLPLVMLALPALRELGVAQFEAFSQSLRQLVESDNEISLFEYALQRLVQRHLAPRFTAEPDARSVQYYALTPLLPDCAVLLSALAYQGQASDDVTRSAFAAGVNRLGSSAESVSLLEPEACDLAQIDRALDRLVQAVPAIKRRVLEACARVVEVDGQLSLREAEILRAVADALDCPMPPVLAAIS